MWWYEIAAVILGFWMVLVIVAVWGLEVRWTRPQRQAHRRKARLGLAGIPAVASVGWLGAPRFLNDPTLVHAAQAAVILLVAAWVVLAVVLSSWLSPHGGPGGDSK